MRSSQVNDGKLLACRGNEQIEAGQGAEDSDRSMSRQLSAESLHSVRHSGMSPLTSLGRP
jgi:hypothetical protein